MQVRAALGRFFTVGERPDAQQISGWSSPAAQRMFWTGLAVRLLYLTLAHTYRIRPSQDHFQFGWEMGRIARALATGYGYADPFTGHTGPTAWTPPLYPLLMAGAFKLFGVYTPAAAWAVLAVNCLASAATAPAIYEIAKRCFGNRADGRAVPLWSGWLWALYPAAMQYAVRWPWEIAVTCCLFTWALVFGLRLQGVGSSLQAFQVPTWAMFGLLWGLVAISNSSLLLFVPVQVAWILWPLRYRLVPVLTRGLVAFLVFLACLAPWVLRNQRVFHALIPSRSNFGAELYMAALPSHNGFPYGTVIPLSTADPEWRRYALMGELAYNRSQGQRGKALIAANPGLFFRQVLLRVQFFWAGVPHPYDHGILDELFRQLDFGFLSVAGLLGLALSVYRRVPAAKLFACAFLVCPLVYYLVTVQARFRAPLEPLIALFAAFLFQNADRTRVWSFRDR
ncbi:MAG: ArnT family glycosyltransferase [Janthinobacterium lividum]